MRCFELSGSDDRFDCSDGFDGPLNKLPAKCITCGFPDLDHITHPYFVVKSRTQTPNEAALAELGNLFVRDRVRKVLELVAPGQCQFWPTMFKGTQELTPWWLTVPVQLVKTATVKAQIRRCQTCNEPRSAHPGTQYDQWLWNRHSEYELLKASTWGSSGDGWNLWMCRDVFMSVRLFYLLQKLKVKGLYETTCGKRTTANAEELAWICQQLKRIEQASISLHPAGTLSATETKWFKAFLKEHAAPEPLRFDTKAAEKQLKFKLPKSYVDFVTQVGPMTFEDVDEQEGFTVKIVRPEDFDTRSYRRGKILTDPESAQIDAVIFGFTEHGDCLCFAVQKGTKEYPIYLFKHEYGFLEPYSENFAACVKRLAKA